MATQDLLTTPESEEARALLKRVLDTGGEVLLPPGQWLLLARYAAQLSPPTPEDVARDAKRVWNAIPTSMHGEFLDGAWSRLRDAAAHGAAIVARVARLEGEAIVLQVDKDAMRHERDAARQEASQEARRAEVMMAERNACAAENEGLRERVATLERDVQALEAESRMRLELVDAEKARAEAAERRVAELEAAR